MNMIPFMLGAEIIELCHFAHHNNMENQNAFENIHRVYKFMSQTQLLPL